MFPGQPKSWVSEGGRTRIHRPRPTLRAGQSPMRTRIGQEVAKGDRQQRRVWLREECPSILNSLEGHQPSQFNEQHTRPGRRSEHVMKV